MKKETTAYGITGFVLSIISLLLWFMPYFGIVFSIAGIVLGNLQTKKNKTGIGVASFVIGIVSTVINAIVLLIILCMFAVLGTAWLN